MSERRTDRLFDAVRAWIMRNAPELQFWGYEGGNLLAAIAGAGGFAVFQASVLTTLSAPETGGAEKMVLLLTQFPDATATIGLAIVVLWSIGLGAAARRSALPGAQVWSDAIAAIAGVLLVCATLLFGASWITLSAVLFVSASVLLRLCRIFPVFLKLGGLLLTAGGFCLATPGVAALRADGDLWVAFFTAGTGLFVAAAGLMTYRGGIDACAAAGQQTAPRAKRGLCQVCGPVARVLETALDKPVNLIVDAVVLPSLIWVDDETKIQAPFLTSMWARLPWRVMTAAAALASGTAYGVTFAAANLCWAVGDVSMGSLDWEREPVDDVTMA